MYSSLDEKMPRPLCGHGMTLGGGLCPRDRHVTPPRPHRHSMAATPPWNPVGFGTDAGGVGGIYNLVP